MEPADHEHDRRALQPLEARHRRVEDEVPLREVAPVGVLVLIFLLHRVSMLRREEYDVFRQPARLKQAIDHVPPDV